MAQVDVSHRTVHKNNVLQTLYNLKTKSDKARDQGRPADLQADVKKALINRYVITQYNKRP